MEKEVLNLKLIENAVKEVINPFVDMIDPDHRIQINCEFDGNVSAILIKKRHPVIKKKLYLKYADGTVFPPHGEISAVKVLREAILVAGPTNVYNLNIPTTGGKNLLSYGFEGIENMQPYPIGGNFYMISKTPTTAKIEQIQTIIKKLKPNFELEIIEKHSK